MKKLNIIAIIACIVFALSSCSKDCDYSQNKCDICPTGFTKNVINDNCELITTQAATFNGSFQNLLKADSNAAYRFGANFYTLPTTTSYPIRSNASGLEDFIGTPLASTASTAPFWNSRLDITGVWSPGVGINQWIGFSHCITVDVDTKICIGIAADNQCRFDVNGSLGTPLVEFNVTHAYNYNYWHVFEYTLLAGTNVIQMEGLDAASPGAFGAEIYRGDLATLQAWTSVTQLEDALIFSTKDPSKFQTGLVAGYSCPNGFVVDFCDDTIPVCSSIQIENYLPCQNIQIP